MPTVIICAITCICMICAVLFFPKIKLWKLHLDSYWVVTMTGAVILILTRRVDIGTVLSGLVANSAINPLKILVLFISMTVLSIFLDELGFFMYLANVTLKRAGTSQTKLFLLLYITVSILTVFTSNDIIILSFTPFICYFAKNAKISPMPYLAAEFVAANTWSMALIIGNPTNIYLATANGVGFVDYLKVMILPTIAAGTISFLLLFLLYRKKLSAPISGSSTHIEIADKFSLGVGIAHLAVTTLLMAIGSYINLEMWLVAACALVSLTLWNIGIAIARHHYPLRFRASLERAPWELIPFILSMFVMIISLDGAGITSTIGSLLGTDAAIWKYGITSFFAANIINNIPMSVLFSSILESVEGDKLGAVFATTVGSNLGACLTPIGALAGIMWSTILRGQNLKFGYLQFLKIGVTVAIPSLLAALLVLQILI